MKIFCPPAFAETATFRQARISATSRAKHKKLLAAQGLTQTKASITHA